jgi:DNA-binding transcriptional regulator YhcF (GntR family)
VPVPAWSERSLLLRGRPDRRAIATTRAARQVALSAPVGVHDVDVRGERLPSAKDLAAILEVNTNTVLRSPRLLRDEGLLEFRRGARYLGRRDAGAGSSRTASPRARRVCSAAQGYRVDELVETSKTSPDQSCSKEIKRHSHTLEHLGVALLDATASSRGTALKSSTEMRGREMKGWLRVDAESVSTKRALERWAMQSVAFAHALPPKDKK